VNDRVLSVILGGGRGARLYPLTKFRAKPAVPIGAKYRLIDVPISNCLHAGFDRIYVLTQFNSASLHRHIKRTYSFDNFSEGFVDILAAEQTTTNESWYQGTADAVRQQLHELLHDQPGLVLVLSGDHLFRMDFRAFVAEHRAARADLSIAVKVVDRATAPGLGILKLGPGGHVVQFREKPKLQAELDELRLPADAVAADAAAPAAAAGDRYLASMGIYLFNPAVLERVLSETPCADFGRDVIPAAISSHHVHAHRFYGYWADIGTIGSFYDANLGLTDPEPAFNFYEPHAPIFTRPGYLAAAWLDGCRLDRAIIGDGSELREATIRRSLVGQRSIIRPGVRLSDTVMMGADYYPSPEQREQLRIRGLPDLGIGEGSVIERAIIDKNACIGRNVRIHGAPGRSDEDAESYSVREGVVVVPKHAIIPDDTEI
jgi:glucose-1-phosphate adenylyltransferase